VIEKDTKTHAERRVALDGGTVRVLEALRDRMVLALAIAEEELHALEVSGDAEGAAVLAAKLEELDGAIAQNEVRTVLAQKVGNLLEFTEEPESTQYLQSRGSWPATLTAVR
jgi:hypothetical protein